MNSVPCVLPSSYIPLIINHCRFNYDLHKPFGVLCSGYNRHYPTISKSNSLLLLKQLILLILAQNCILLFSSNYIFIFLRGYHIVNLCVTTHGSAPRSVGKEVWPWNPSRKQKNKQFFKLTIAQGRGASISRRSFGTGRYCHTRK